MGVLLAAAPATPAASATAAAVPAVCAGDASLGTFQILVRPFSPGAPLPLKSGRSDPFVLGRVIRIPRLDKFTLSSEKVGDSSYAGTLEGRDLDVIDKVGWDAQNRVPVAAIPAPIPGDPARQTLRIVLSWPAPGPHAPLYVWLRGEQTGRKTAVAY